ncbi:TPA: helix-turn-helix transcriptional regulator [Methanocaldococcus jannaschii]|uniref:Uncharacterized protein MJ0944 n=2 Tax=Methanocaldococcus jannaschii TaxID=2190 RepID=Y944_METJA|nr:helix-turn-helix domain-containing protein [Methanocaldococcus jannaschii]Q58354.1 RecName: Full=Uncharacterized protein MJ0944 [Methanocaldococcus jannaschii DSM 2661]AAB98954.1 hypothetical protein MJ_0944 [Methanocaldococcus jannaschii DSM 2661]HII59807.1 helix-turn-helix transcriptional regulator [Methanocaldococcus jannaschii]
MLIGILSKKYVKEILELLNEKGELHFSQIHKEIPTHMSSLNRTLNELVKLGLISKRKEDNKQALPKTYYKLTPLGKKALLLYEVEKIIENSKNNQNIIIQIINGKNHNIINAKIVNIHNK